MKERHNGTIPKPQALKKLQGTYQPYRDGGVENRLNKKKPVCPSWLDKEAKAEWRRISKELYNAGLLRAVDKTALALYCRSFSIWKRASLLVDEKGFIVKTKNGNIIQSPALGIANVQAREMMKALKEFGMTPASRSRLVPDDDTEKEPSLAEQMFAIVNES